MGGLGNVLFQLFAATLLNRKHGYVVLSEFLISHNICTHLLGWKIHPNLFSKLRLERLIKQKPKSVIKPRLYIKSDTLTPGYHMSYFQNKTMISENIEDFKAYLSNLRTLLYAHFEQSEINHEVVLHIRGTDANVKTSLEWMSQIKLKYKNIFIATDDTSLATQIFPKDKYFYGDNILMDFYFMIHSSVLIVSDSTLSWWAAHLNQTASVIYMPRKLYSRLGYHGSSELRIYEM